jgi:hypothetical protein
MTTSFDLPPILWHLSLFHTLSSFKTLDCNDWRDAFAKRANLLAKHATAQVADLAGNGWQMSTVSWIAAL